MFHHHFLKLCRDGIHEPDARLIPEDQWSDAVHQAHNEALVAMPAFSLPTGVMVAEGVTEAAFDGHIIKKIRDWFQTPQGQNFLAILKKIAIAIIIGLISGS